MDYYWKCFLWENGGKSTEYTKYMVQPFFFADHLDETLDEGEIILESMPISSAEAFPPKTKFRIERYTSLTEGQAPNRTYDLVVEHDDVEEFVGVPDICTHRISLIEASVVAQGMHVDNIALTYELQDVTMNYKTTKTDDDKVVVSAPPGGYPDGVRLTDGITYGWGVANSNYFKNSYSYVWKGIDSENGLSKLKSILNASDENIICFKIPELWCQGCYGGKVWTELFKMNTKTYIYKQETLNGVPQETKTLVTDYPILSGPTSMQTKNDTLFQSDGYNIYLRAVADWDTERYDTSGFDARWSTFPRVAHVSNEFTNNVVSFTVEPLSSDEIESGKGYLYSIECFCAPDNSDGLIQYYEKVFYGSYEEYISDSGAPKKKYDGYARDRKIMTEDLKNIKVKTTFEIKDSSVVNEGGYFLMKGVKYRCYQLLRKAMLTLDTHVIDNSITGLDEHILANNNVDPNNIQYPILVNPFWLGRLKNATINETIFEGKNFWEVCLQLGYYLHAIPYFEFANDGTDRFVLAFHQLGEAGTEPGKEPKPDTSVKLTIFNSRTIYDFFTAYDSYVTNLFSPQNLVEEWIVPKAAGSDYLVYNDSAIAQVSYPMTEVVAFEIRLNGSGEWKDALKPQKQIDDNKINLSGKLFEQSVYQVLTSFHNVSPSKADSLYFKMGDRLIQGLNYVPPSDKNDQPMALKKIVRQLFGVSTDSLKFNDLEFHIKYRTQDTARITQIRPDIQKFIQNSSYEKYPHHEQFYGQQDKIIDSERFAANLYGKLIRCGNATYQRQEYCQSSNEKEAGDLVAIGKHNYYVMSTENEYYNSCILQKVTYSRDFNQISQVCTIPSEPRFYEVSERSMVRREVRMMDFLKLSTTKNTESGVPRFLNNNSWQNFIKDLLFYDSVTTSESIPPVLPNYAYTRFLGDLKRDHTGQYGQDVQQKELFPSSEIDRTDPNSIKPKSSSDHVDTIVPLLHFPSYNSLVFEWDMEDNFKAGDYVDTGTAGIKTNNFNAEIEVRLEGQNQPFKGTMAGTSVSTADKAYYSQQPLRYCDIMGRADLFTFKLFNKTDWTKEQNQAMPKALLIPTDTNCQILSPVNRSIGLDKDCREALSFNYQINLLHNASDEDAEDFIIFPNVWGEKNARLKMAFCSDVKSMFDEVVDFSKVISGAESVTYTLILTTNAIELNITAPNNVDTAKVNSIVLYDEDKEENKIAYIIKNVSKLDNDKKLQRWWIYPVFNNYI